MPIFSRFILNSIIILVITILGLEKADCNEQQWIREGYTAGETVPAQNIPRERTIFDHKTGSFMITPPEGYLFKELAPSFGGKVFLFTGPQDAEKRSSSINITVVTRGPNKPPNSISGIIATIIEPFEKRLTNYARKNKQPFNNDGLSFQGASFSGQLSTVPIVGTVFVTRMNNIVYIFLGICPKKEEANRFDIVFSDMLKSFRVVP